MNAPTTVPVVPIVSRLPRLRGRQARPWLDAATALAFSCSLDVHGLQDPRTVDAVRIMAVSVFQTSGSKPDWAKLDVDHCLALARSVGFPDEALGVLAVEIHTFVCFLNKFTLIDNADAVRLSDRLEPLVAPVYEQVLAGEQDTLDDDTDPPDQRMLN